MYIGMEISGEYLCNVIRVTVSSLLIVDRIFTVCHHKADIPHSRQGTFASYLCPAHFPLEEVGKIDLELHAKQQHFPLTWLDTGHQSVVKVCMVFNNTRDPVRPVLQIKTIGTSSLINILMCFGNLGYSFFPMEMHKNAVCAEVK